MVVRVKTESSCERTFKVVSPIKMWVLVIFESVTPNSFLLLMGPSKALMISMCRVVSCEVGGECLLWPMHSLGQTEVPNIIQEAVIKTIPKKKKCKKAKWLSGEALQIAEKRREANGKEEKERYSHLNAEFQRIARRDKKAFLSDQRKKIEENNRMGRLEISSRKLEISREHFRQRWAQ